MHTVICDTLPTELLPLAEGSFMSSVYPPFGGPPAQRCLRCGTPLPPNVVTCVNCGTYNPVAQSGGSQPQTAYGGGQYSGPQWGQAPVSSPQNNQWGQPPAFPQNNAYSAPPPPPPSSLNNFYGMPGQTQQSNFNNYNPASQQNAYFSAPAATYEGYAPAGYNQSPQKKRGPGIGLIVGTILLLIILVGGAFAGYAFYKSRNQNSSVTATPTSVSTPSLTPLFRDAFADNTTGWDLTSIPGKFSVKVGSGSMILEDDDNKLLWEILPGKTFTDFRLDVDATLSRGDPNNGYGVYIRGASSQDSDLGTYYRFELYGDGTYAIFKGSLDTTGHTQSNMVQSYTQHNAIAKAGNVNHITIVAKGPTMTLMVNGQTVYTYTDVNYKSGSVALFVSNLPKLTPGAQATFARLAVFPAA
ncbi:MAG TPA: family 16 glycoside hydrolase [Ktedonobacteraceae bacterium]